MFSNGRDFKLVSGGWSREQWLEIIQLDLARQFHECELATSLRTLLTQSHAFFYS